MNILILSHTFPFPPNEGIKLPLYNLIKEFSKTEKVSLLSFISNEEKIYISEIERYLENLCTIEHYPSKSFFRRVFSIFFSKKPYCVEQFFIKDFVDSLQNMLLKEKYDVIFFDFINTAMYQIFLRKIYKGKKILFLHDAMSMLFYRNFLVSKNFFEKYYWFNQYIKLLNFEFELQNNFDKLVVVAQKDKEWLIQKSNILEDKVEVIPNGVDTEYFYYKDNKNFTKKGSILFRGIMSFRPNIDACMYFLDKIFPLIKKEILDIKFYIVGPNPPTQILKYAARDKNIIVTGYVEDIREYIAKTTVNVCPMISGSGIKNKILESLAMGTPSVITSIAAEGIPELKDGENVLIADTEHNFAKKVVLLLKNDKLYKKISLNGRKLIEEKYTWQIVARKFLDLFSS